MLIALVAYLLAGNELTAEKVFVAVALFNGCRLPLTLFLPLGLQFFFEAKVACSRIQVGCVGSGFLKAQLIQKFLELEEHEYSRPIPAIGEKSDGQAFVEMRDYSAKWEEDTLEPTLDKISFRAEPGQLIAIIGPVGAGKVGHVHFVSERYTIPRHRYSRRSSARRTVWTAR